MVESLNSLSVDIARAIDHDASVDLWRRYQRGERDVFTRRLYTLKGQQTFDEIKRKYDREPEFRTAVDRYIADFEKLLADYEILQPFAQLGRPVFALSAEESTATQLDRFAGITVPALKVLGLERRGWRRSQPADGGVQAHVLRDLPDGRKIIVDLEPGLWIGAIAECPDQSIREIWVTDATGEEWYYHPPKTGGILLSSMDPVTTSELLRDLTEVTAQ